MLNDKQKQIVHLWRLKSSKLDRGQQIRLTADPVSYWALRDNDGTYYIVRMAEDIDKGLERFNRRLPEYDIVRADGSLIGKAQTIASMK